MAERDGWWERIHVDDGDKKNMHAAIRGTSQTVREAYEEVGI